MLRDFSLPVVVKARSSFRSEDLGDRRRTRVARDPDALRQWLHVLIGRADEVLIEEYFEGEGGGIDLLCADGEVLHAFQHLRLHEGRGYSSAPYRLSEPVHQGMLADARKFVRALDYTGVLMMEFRLNRATDQWLFHDFNARFWAALPLTVASGADYPYWLYQVLVEGKRDFPRRTASGIACRNWRLDLLWVKENLSLPRARAHARARAGAARPGASSPCASGATRWCATIRCRASSTCRASPAGSAAPSAAAVGCSPRRHDSLRSFGFGGCRHRGKRKRQDGPDARLSRRSSVASGRSNASATATYHAS